MNLEPAKSTKYLDHVLMIKDLFQRMAVISRLIFIKTSKKKTKKKKSKKSSHEKEQSLTDKKVSKRDSRRDSHR